MSLSVDNEDAVTLQPGSITKSQNTKIEPSLYEILQRQFRTRSFVDHRSFCLQLNMLYKVSELADTQRELLSIERKRLKLEKSKVLPRRWLNRTHLENIRMLESNGHWLLLILINELFNLKDSHNCRYSFCGLCPYRFNEKFDTQLLHRNI